MVLDYSVFVEMLENDAGGIFRSWPTLRDCATNMERFFSEEISGARQEPLVLLTQDQLASLVEQMNAFIRCRTDTHGGWKRHHGECPYCRDQLSHKTIDRGPPGRSFSISECRSCGWWETFEYFPPVAGGAGHDDRGISRRAVLRSFNIGDLELPIGALRRHLATHSTDLQSISPSKLERLVGDVFSDFMDCEAVHVGGPNDGGVDLILVQGKKQHAVQVKRRGPASGGESVSGIREFLGALVLNQQVSGIFVTTADHFSPQAVRAAKRSRDVGAVERIDLVDASKLIDVCRLAERRNRRPWEEAVLPADAAVAAQEMTTTAAVSLLLGTDRWDVDPDTFLSAAPFDDEYADK